MRSSRRLMQLKIEREALRAEPDRASQERLQKQNPSFCSRSCEAQSVRRAAPRAQS